MGTAFKLKNGSILLSTEAPGGIYNSNQLKTIAALSDEDAAIVKVTEDQRLALFVKPEKADEIAKKLKAIGLGIRHYQSGLHQPTSCLGEMCPEHQQDALGAAMSTSEALAQITLESPLRIGINGCARCCVPCHTLDISVVGDENGYKIYLGGKNTQIPEVASFMAEAVPQDRLPDYLKKIVELYKQNQQDDESLQDVMDRIGVGRFVKILHPYSQDAQQEENFDVEIGEDIPEELPEINSEDISPEEETLGEDLEFDTGASELADEDAFDLSEEPVSDEPISDEPISEEPFLDEPILDEPILDEPISDEPTAEDHGILEDDTYVADPVIEEEMPLEEDEPQVQGQNSHSQLSGPTAAEVLDYQNRSYDKRLDALEQDNDDDDDDYGVEIPLEEDASEIAVEDFSEESLEIDNDMKLDVGLDESPGDEIGIDENLNDEDLVLSDDDENLALDGEISSLDEDGIEELEIDPNDESDIEKRVHVELDAVSNFSRKKDQNAQDRHEAVKLVDSDEGNTPGSASKEHWDFTGFHIEEGTKLILSFSSGATIELNSENIKSGKRSFEISGRQIRVSSSNDKVHVELDEDFKVMIPNKSA